MCRIVADPSELVGGVPDSLAGHGVAVDLLPLPAGDYDLAHGVLVERKTIPDLHLSLERGRLWRQIGALRRSSRLPYLLIEGDDLDAGSIHPSAIRGACLAVIGQGVPVLWSRNTADSALWLRLLAGRAAGKRPGRDRPFYAQRLKPPTEQVPEAMLGAVPGISVVGARALLEHFGTVAGVVAAGPSGWLDVRGIGPVRAAALQRAIF